MPQLSPLWRSSLRIWLAATLSIGILLWSGRANVLALALIMAVLFVNENDFTPARSIAQIVAGALIGILTALVIHELSTSWAVLAIALLVTGVLVRGLGLMKGLSTAYMGCWAIDLMHKGNQFNWALIFNLAFAAVVGILVAQVATWALWPRRPLDQLPALDAGIASQFAQQISLMQQWIANGGTPPLALRSKELLPKIQLLQQLRDQKLSGLQQGSPMPTNNKHLVSRWAQAGSIWRQFLRQWLLLEPLLRQLSPPLAPANQHLEANALLLTTLTELAACLQAPANLDRGQAINNQSERWLEQATSLGESKPLLLAIGQQCQALQQLSRSRSLLNSAVAKLSAGAT